MTVRSTNLLALLLSAVSNEDGVKCKTDPCVVCTVAEAAQSYLNELRPHLSTGWWWVENDEDIIAALDNRRTVSNCGLCGFRMHWIECPTGGWWAHDIHPADDHDACER